MQKLEVFATTPFYTNVAMNRGTVSALELHERVLTAMNQGVAIFTFLKVDGETTKTVIGTVSPNIIPSKVAQFVEEHPQLLISFKTTYDAVEHSEQSTDPEEDAYNMHKGEIAENAKATEAFLNKLNAPPKEVKINSEFQNYYDVQAQKWGKYKIDNLLALILTDNTGE